MRIRNHLFRITKFFSSVVMASSLMFSTAVAEAITIPANTRIYVETDQRVSGKKKHTQLGQVVRASVWRDVIVDGYVVIDAGTSALVRVDRIKGAKIAGIKGKMTLGAYDTTTVDDTTIDLGGGYFKEGKGRIALAATLAGVVFLPLIFIKGKSAHLPRGTIFDAYTKRRIDIEVSERKTPSRSLNLSGVLDPGLKVEMLYDELEATENPKNFAFAIEAPVGSSGEFIIDVVNNVQIDKELELDSEQTGAKGEAEFWRGEVKIKKLGKNFKKGINTFEIATLIDGERIAEKIVLDIQF